MKVQEVESSLNHDELDFFIKVGGLAPTRPLGTPPGKAPRDGRDILALVSSSSVLGTQIVGTIRVEYWGVYIASHFRGILNFFFRGQLESRNLKFQPHVPIGGLSDSGHEINFKAPSDSRISRNCLHLTIFYTSTRESVALSYSSSSSSSSSFSSSSSSSSSFFSSSSSSSPLQGNISLEKSSRRKPFEWLPDQGWEDVVKLSTGSPDVFGSLPDDIERGGQSWKQVGAGLGGGGRGWKHVGAGLGGGGRGWEGGTGRAQLLAEGQLLLCTMLS